VRKISGFVLCMLAFSVIISSRIAVLASTAETVDFASHYILAHNGSIDFSGRNNWRLRLRFDEIFFSRNHIVIFEVTQPIAQMRNNVSGVRANGDVILERLPIAHYPLHMESHWFIILEFDRRFAPERFNLITDDEWEWQEVNPPRVIRDFSEWNEIADIEVWYPPEYMRPTKNEQILYFNGGRLELDVSAFSMGRSVMFPARAVLEALGVPFVRWNQNTRMLDTRWEGYNITFQIDNHRVYFQAYGDTPEVYGTLDYDFYIYMGFPAPMIENDRVLIPLRTISVIFGARIRWDESMRIVRITTTDERSPSVEFASQYIGTWGGTWSTWEEDMDINYLINAHIFSKYDDDFFTENYLVVFVVDQPNISLDYYVYDVQENGDIILRYIPPRGLRAPGFSRWLVVIELDNQFAPYNFSIIFDGSWGWRRSEIQYEIINERPHTLP